MPRGTKYDKAALTELSYANNPCRRPQFIGRIKFTSRQLVNIEALVILQRQGTFSVSVVTLTQVATKHEFGVRSYIVHESMHMFRRLKVHMQSTDMMTSHRKGPA